MWIDEDMNKAWRRRILEDADEEKEAGFQKMRKLVLWLREKHPDVAKEYENLLLTEVIFPAE